jgi:hypothetical protein
MKGTIRVWLDELKALPEYSCSVPSGQYPGKSWKRNVLAFARLPGPTVFEEWWIGQYHAVPGFSGYVYTFWFKVVLLQGPRRGNEKSRLSEDGVRPTKVVDGVTVTVW